MTYNDDWQTLENTPTDTSVARNIDDFMRGLAKGVGERLTNMFYGFTGTESQEGIKRLEFIDQAADPTDVNTLYTKAGEIYLKDGAGNVVQFSNSGYIPLSSTRIANDTYIIARNAADDGNVNLIKINASDEAEIAQNLNLNGDLSFVSGTNVNEFSTDGTLADNSDNAVPTEQAVKTYHDNNDTTKSLGSWDDTKSENTVYQATTDGFVTAYTVETGNANNYMKGLTDGSNPPTTIRAFDKKGRNDSTFNFFRSTVTFPVKKNDYWEVDTNQSATVYFLPLS